jgi:hypothetical protein
MEPECSSPCQREPTLSPYPELDQSSPIPPHPISVRSVLILSSHLRLRFHSDLFASGFSIVTHYVFLISLMRTTCYVHLILLHSRFRQRRW